MRVAQFVSETPRDSTSAQVQELLSRTAGGHMGSLVRFLGFSTLSCGCVTGRYRELATNREITYVEEKGTTCVQHGHRRNHTLALPRTARRMTAKAS